MSYTIEEASDDSSDWVIHAKLVSCRMFYRGYRGRILQLVFVDENDHTLELKTFSVTKAYTVYRKLARDQSYEITGSGSIKQSDCQYTPTDYIFCGYGPQWMVEPLEDDQVRGRIRCTSNLDTALAKIKSQGNANLVGAYKTHYLLPQAVKYPIGSDEHLIQGYRVALIDELGRLFHVTVWHTKNIDKNNFELFQCEPGDPVLFLGVRIDDYVPESKTIKFKSNYNPVLDSGCISEARKKSIKLEL